MTHRHSIRRAFAWLLAGRTGEQVLNFVFGVVLARLLAPEDFGLLLTIQVFTGAANLISGGGMGQALVRAKEVSRVDFDVVFTLQLLVGLFIYASFFAAAPWLSHWYENPAYTDLVRVIALSFVYRPLANVPTNLLYREGRYRVRTLIGFACIVATSLSSIALALQGLGVWSLIWGGVVGALVNIALSMAASGWRPRLSLDMTHGRKLAGYGFLVSANDIVDYVRSRTSIFVLSHQLGPAAVGLYNKAESLAQMPFAFVSGSAYQVMFQAMAREQDQLDKCRYIFLRGVTLVAVYGTPFYIGLFWLAEPLMRGVYGAKWVGAAQPLAILSLAWPIWIIENMSGAVTAALDRLRGEVQIHTANVFVALLAVLIALPYGLAAVAWAIVFASAFSCAFLCRLAARSLNMDSMACVRALAPAAVLAPPLMLMFGLVDLADPMLLHDHDLARVASLGVSGALVYSASLLLMPISALKTERDRLREGLAWVWRRRLA